MARKPNPWKNRDSEEHLAELATIEENLKIFEDELEETGNIWGFSKKGLHGQRAAMSALSTKTGMYAKVPITCKGDNCPYSETCKLLPYDLAPEGEPCPIETTQIELFGKGYSQDIDIESTSFVDKRLVSDLIKYDVMLERCMALMAKEGTPVIDVIIGVADDGTEIRQPVVSKAWEAYEKISKKRNDTYQLLMMTRKDKKKDDSESDKSISEMLSEVLVEQSEE